MCDRGAHCILTTTKNEIKAGPNRRCLELQAHKAQGVIGPQQKPFSGCYE